MLKIKKVPKRKGRIIIGGAIALVVLAVAGGSFWYYKTHFNQSHISSNGINYGPPTEQEKKAAQQKKDEIAAQHEQPPAQPTPASSIVPVLTQWGEYNGNIEVVGYVPGIVEDGGTCTYTFSQGSSTFNKETKGVDNVSTTSCPTVSVPTSQFSPKGTWSVTLTYKQLNGANTKASEPRTINL